MSIGVGPNGPILIYDETFREKYELWLAKHDENSLDKKELGFRAAVWARDLEMEEDNIASLIGGMIIGVVVTVLAAAGAKYL